MTETTDSFVQADVQTVAEVLLADYESQYSAEHLTWRDFEAPAWRAVSAIAPSIARQAGALALRDAAQIVADCAGQGLGLAAAERAILAFADETDPRPCRGVNPNVCAAEGCFGEACRP